jgi:4-amino-4-deoxy-L-arabinose transferase-like glycosyltransferase
MTFLGDEGRDVLVAKGILEGDLTLLGPRSSAGDFFMGPIYYYMITPFLWLFNNDPVGPAIMVALFGIATVWLIYFVGKKWFNTATGLTASALYSVSPIVITYSHSSWNPNVLPFFALLLMYWLVEIVTKQKSWRHFLIIGFLLGIALQLHYLSLFLCVIVAVYVFWGARLIKKKLDFKRLAKQYLQIFAGFLIGFSPFLAFEIRHGFINIKTILSFIFGGTADKSTETGATFLAIISDVFFRIFAKLVFYFPSIDKYQNFTPQQLQLFGVFTMIIAFASVICLWFVKNKSARLLVILWLALGVLLFGFYKKQIHDYHFTYLFPLPFLIVGNFFSQFLEWGKTRVQKIILMSLGIIIFVGAFLYNFSGMPFQYIPNRQKDQVRLIAEAVIEHSDNKPYNFALISKGNSDHAYRYYLEVLGHEPVTLENTIIDPERKTVMDQLLIVCEDITCKPLGDSLFDVAGFGRAEIVGEWDVSVVKVYKLVPFVEK